MSEQSSTSSHPVTVVTGANSGIGRATAVLLAARGHRVFATMRTPAKADKLLAMADTAHTSVEVVALDVNDDASVRDGIAAVVAKAGPVDVLVNNAGIGYNSTVEDLDIGRAKDLFETNFWGAIRCTQAVLPSMRERRSGHIVNISSIAGLVSAPAQLAYTSSKWAMECMSEHLAMEAAHYGVRVSIIEPGVTRTAILAKNTDTPDNSAYGWLYGRELAFYAAGLVANVQPEAVAETIWTALTNAEAKLRYKVAWSAEEFSHGRGHLSDEDWVALAGTELDEDYYAGFQAAFGLDIRPA